MMKNFKKSKISVALCTYNGELYLSDQLESIVKQTRLPDEIIVCDDCSTDSTLEILDNFQKISPIPLKIYANEKNLGVSKNFEKAISLCSGDIIFLSDQDDVWLPEKIEKLTEVFNCNKDCLYVFSDAYVVDNDLCPLGYTMWESVSFNSFQRKKFLKGQQLEILLKHNVVTGATMAFRSELNEIVLPIPEIWIHDAWIGLLGSILGKGCFIEEPLIYYRQHNNQLIGGKKRGIVDKLRIALSNISIADLNYTLEKEKHRILNDRVFKHVGKVNNKIEDKIHHLEQRVKINKSSNLLDFKIVILELLLKRYFKYSNGFWSATKDIFVLFKNLINKIIERKRGEEK